jgi:tellurite methyltransferase
MQRTITSFAVDELGDPIARLDCGHVQHVRHQPPFQLRPWVLTVEGRASMLGSTLFCQRCTRMEWPADFVAYKRTPEFTAESVPAGLLRDHATKRGVWARIVVLEGELRYQIVSLEVDTVLTPQQGGIVVPEVLHSVEPLGAVRFYVEFFRAKPGTPLFASPVRAQ